MSERLQTVVDDELAEAVKKAAAAERRSVSEWIAFRLEECFEYPEVEEAARKGTGPFKVNPMPPCNHDLAAKRQTSFGFVRDCIKCGAAVPV